MEKEKLPVKTDREQIIYYEDEIDLYELWLTLKKRWKTVAGTVVLFLIVASVYIMLSKPVYRYIIYLKIPVSFHKENVYNPVDFSEISNIITNFKFKNIKNIDVQIPQEYKKLRQNYVKVISVSFESFNTNSFRNLKKTFMNKLKKEEYLTDIYHEINSLKNLLNTVENKIFESTDFFQQLLLQEKKIKLKEAIYNLEFKIVSDSGLPSEPYKPRKSLIIAVAAVSGLFVGIFLAFFMEWIENARKRHRESITE